MTDAFVLLKLTYHTHALIKTLDDIASAHLWKINEVLMFTGLKECKYT